MARLAAFWTLSMVACMYAQAPYGTIAGTVRDSSGAAVAAASITVRNLNTRDARTLSTDGAGMFQAPNLAAGSYEITATKSGFRTLRETDIAVQANRVAQLTLALEVGSASEAIEVPAQNRDVDADSEGILNELRFLELSELVQDTRTITDMGYFASGVARRANGGLGSGFVVGGARADNTNFVVDGFSDVDPRTGSTQVTPNWDAIEEFRVQTTGSTAEYGRLAGGVMNMVLRSGTNRFHGSAFDYFRSDALAARNYFDATKSHLLSNQFGATVGGPLRKDRMFFLVSWEGVRQSSGTNRFSLVPSALERQGDFSKSVDASGRPVTVTDPSGGAPFPANRIPVDRLDAVAMRVLPYYPLANNTGPEGNYRADQLTDSTWDSLLAKVDERLTGKDSLSFRYLTRVNSNLSPYTGGDLGVFGSRIHSRPTLAGANYTRVFSPTLVNEFRAGFVRMSDHEAGLDAGADVGAQLGLPAGLEPHVQGFPRFTVQNLAPLGNSTSMPLDFTINNYEVANALSWSSHRHLLKFGVDVLRTQFFQRLATNARGSFNFLGRWSGVALADLLLGLPDSTSRQASSDSAYLFSTDAGIFVQDQFNVTSRLTLHYGLRYELMAPPAEKYGRMSNFVPELAMLVVADPKTLPDFAQRIAAAGLTGRVTTAAQAGLPDSLTYASHRQLAPRFGFAFKPTGKSDFVIRGGYGIYFANSLMNPIRNDLTNVYPFTVSQTFNRVTGQPGALTLENPFPAKLASLPGVTNVNGFDLHAQPQYLQSYTLAVERQLDSVTTLELEYIGSRGTHLERQYDLNQPFRTLAFRQPNGSFPRLFVGFGTINFYSFGSNSVYNAGWLTLRRSWRKGLFYGATYVYGKSIDDASQISGNSAGDYPGAQNSRDLAAERGRSDWDTGHSLTFFGGYSLPFRRGAWRRGWQISATGRFYTGQPFTPRVSSANLNLGEANRPDRVGSGKSADPSATQWFDIAAFPTVPTGAFRFGTSGRNILDGPGNATVNAAITRNFRVRDRGTVSFRCEAINVFNRVNFGLPVDYVDVKNAGQLLSADPGRTFQMGLRVRF